MRLIFRRSTGRERRKRNVASVVVLCFIAFRVVRWKGYADLLEGHKDGIVMKMRFESGVAVVRSISPRTRLAMLAPRDSPIMPILINIWQSRSKQITGGGMHMTLTLVFYHNTVQTDPMLADLMQHLHH
jgi:hypothetical protein